MDVLKAVLLGVVEGLTEFLPISSTGHLILVERPMALAGSPGFAEAFMILIQFPAVVAVVLYFRRRLWPFYQDNRTPAVCLLWFKVAVAFLPAAVLGVLLDDVIEAYLFSPGSVAAALVVGGIALLWLEWTPRMVAYETVDELSWKAIVGTGMAQCLAMIPGTSRSAATIFGAMILGAGRSAAAEFSFFLAVPTLLGACAYKAMKAGTGFTAREWGLIGLGGAASFVTAYLVVAAFMNYIRRHSFRPFGYYRIALGLWIGLLLLLGWF